MSAAGIGISAVVTAPLREEAVLDLAAVLDGLVPGEFEILFVDRDVEAVATLQLRMPGLPLRALDLDVASAVSRARYDMILLVSGQGELDVCELNHFVDAIDAGADLAIGYRPWSAERFAWSALGHLLFGKTARDVECPFKLFRRSVWQRTSMEPPGADRWFSTRLIVRARRLGFRVAELPVGRAATNFAQATLREPVS
jgi:hypothetical protein